MFFNIALLICGFGATIAAFGGDTWIKSSQPLIRRITLRGWISLLLGILALVIGVAKEWTNNTRQRISAERDHNQLESLKSELATANSQVQSLLSLASSSASGFLYAPKKEAPSGLLIVADGQPISFSGRFRITYEIQGAYNGGAKLRISGQDYPLSGVSGEFDVTSRNTPAVIEIFHPPKTKLIPAQYADLRWPSKKRLMIAPERTEYTPLFAAVKFTLRKW